MKTIASAHTTMIATRANLLVWRLKITRRDGFVLALVGYDRNVTIGGVLHLAAPGFDVASFHSTSGLAVGNNELTILAESGYVDKLDVLAGKWDRAAYCIDQVNPKVPADGLIPFPYGWLGNVEPQYGSYKVELRDLRQALQQDSTAIFQEPCRYDLGDDRCTVDLAPLTVTGTIDAVTSQSQFTDVARIESNDYFGWGLLTWTSGGNSGITVKVRTYTVGNVLLDVPMIYPIVAGDAYSMTPGCRKRHTEDCITKFDNVLNFGGDVGKPTGDAVISPQPS